MKRGADEAMAEEEEGSAIIKKRKLGKPPPVPAPAARPAPASLDPFAAAADSPPDSPSPLPSDDDLQVDPPTPSTAPKPGPSHGFHSKKTPPKKKGPLSHPGSPANSDDEGREGGGGGGEGGGGAGGGGLKGKEEDDEEEENLEFDVGKGQPVVVDPDRMQALLARFTPEQMNRYECYRRSGFQKSNMRRDCSAGACERNWSAYSLIHMKIRNRLSTAQLERLVFCRANLRLFRNFSSLAGPKQFLQSIAGCPVSMPMTIVMSGIAKLFVGELVETGREIMNERKDSGPIRPCHVREAYRRLRIKGKVPVRTRPRLFH